MEEERLQKYIARCGIASRRSCEEMILAGRVQINGTVVKILGTKINPGKDRVCVDGKVIYPEENKVYVALNKPVGYVSTVKDERSRKTIMDLVKVNERIYPIGRLDYDSSGLIILTNDGEIYNNVIHPRVEVKKVYMVCVQGNPKQNEILRFKNGIDIDDYITAPADFEIISRNNNSCMARVTIHEGKNRQIRRMCEKIGHQVISLQRISIGEIQLGNLPSGKWRNLTGKEIDYLKNLG